MGELSGHLQVPALPQAAWRGQEKSPGSLLAAGDWFWRGPRQRPHSSPAWHCCPAASQAAGRDGPWSEHTGHAALLAAMVLNKLFCFEGFS